MDRLENVLRQLERRTKQKHRRKDDSTMGGKTQEQYDSMIETIKKEWVSPPGVSLGDIAVGCDMGKNIPKVIEPYFACSYMQELYSKFPLIASLLKCDVKDLYCLDSGPGNYMQDPLLRDEAIEYIGPLDGVPFVASSMKKHGQYPVHRRGITLFQARGNDFQYVSYCTARDDGSPDNCIIVKVGSVYRYRRHVLRQGKKHEQFSGKLPILEKEFVDEIMNATIGFLQQRKLFKNYGVKIKRGIVFTGNPGNGKSMMCRYLRAQASSNGINTSTVDASNIEDAFQKGILPRLLNQEGLVFIDDVDIAYFSRKQGQAKIACSLLSAMDGLEISGNTVRIFTTNEDCKDMDPAFQRPGRIDRVFEFPRPTHELRTRFVKSWHQEIVDYLIEGHHFEQLIADTENMSFAEVDLVKTNLVGGFIQDGRWDVSAAIEMTKNRIGDIKSEATRKKAGFGK